MCKLSVEEFENEIKERLEAKGYKIKQHIVRKNNGCEYHGLIINKGRINPCVYIDHDYDKYCKESNNNESVINDAVDYIIEAVNSPNPFIYDNIELLFDLDKVKEKIRMKLINTMENIDFLKKVPHREFLNFSIVYYIELDNNEDTVASITISNDYMHSLHLTEGELHDMAVRNNITKHDVKFQSVVSVINEARPDIDLPNEKEKGRLYVLSNKSRMYGAVAMTNLVIMKNIAERLQSDYYIIPSSIHELIIVPKEKSIPLPELKKMVEELNKMAVPKEDYLSDNIYEFNIMENRVNIAA